MEHIDRFFKFCLLKETVNVDVNLVGVALLPVIFVVFDLKGRQILEGEGHGCPVYGLNLSSLPGGVYVIRAQASTGEVQAFKVIK